MQKHRQPVFCQATTFAGGLDKWGKVFAVESVINTKWGVHPLF